MANHGAYYPPVVPEPAQREPDNPQLYLPPLPNVTAERRAELHAATIASLARVRPFGLGDNLPNYQRWLEESDVYRKLIFETVNIPPFVGHVVIDPRAAAVIYFYSTGRVLATGITTPDLDIALCCAEFLMPVINRGLFCDMAESRRILVSSVQALMRNERKLRQELRNIGEARRAAITSEAGDINQSCIADLWGRMPANCPFGADNPIPADIPFTIEEAARMTPQEAMI
jgi:hypothetical protein